MEITSVTINDIDEISPVKITNCFDGNNLVLKMISVEEALSIWENIKSLLPGGIFKYDSFSFAHYLRRYSKNASIPKPARKAWIRIFELIDRKKSQSCALCGEDASLAGIVCFNHRGNKGEQSSIGLRLFTTRDVFTVDHIRPKSKGGDESLVNMQLMCAHCNNQLGNRAIAYKR